MLALLLAALAVLAAPTRAAEPWGVLAILEGDAWVYRGTGRMHGADGLALWPGDLVETSGSTFAQVERADRTVVQLGPATRVMLQAGSDGLRLYLLDGWARVAGAGAPHEARPAPAVDARTPLLEAPASPAVVVLRSAPQEASLWVERGHARVRERPAAESARPVELARGEFFRRRAGGRGAAAPGPTQAFATEMPRGLRDAVRWQGTAAGAPPAAPGRLARDFSYAEVEPWLKAEPAVRRLLVPRWQAKAREPAFRAALLANMDAHPEWGRVLGATAAPRAVAVP